MKPNQQKLRISKEKTLAFAKKVFSIKFLLNKSCLNLYEILFSWRASNYMRMSVMDSWTYFPIVIPCYVNLQAVILVYIIIFS